MNGQQQLVLLLFPFACVSGVLLQGPVLKHGCQQRRKGSIPSLFFGSLLSSENYSSATDWVTENVCAMAVFHIDGPVAAQQQDRDLITTVTQATVR